MPKRQTSARCQHGTRLSVQALLQVKSLQAGHCPKCPYCKADFSIYFHGPISSEQKLKYQAEEQQQALAAKRAQQVGLPSLLSS